jgi:hypothetical protein
MTQETPEPTTTTDTANEQLLNEYQMETPDFGPMIEDVQESIETEGVLPDLLLPTPVLVIHGTPRSGRSCKPTAK